MVVSEYDRLREQLHVIWMAPVFDHLTWHRLCCELWDVLEHEFVEPDDVNAAEKFLDDRPKKLEKQH